MEVFTRFLYSFLSQVFLGFSTILKGIVTGIIQICDIKTYQDVLNTYKGDLSIPEWGLVILVIVFMVVFIGLIIALIYLLIRKYLKFRKSAIEQDQLLDEVANLNGQVATLM